MCISIINALQFWLKNCGLSLNVITLNEYFEIFKYSNVLIENWKQLNLTSSSHWLIPILKCILFFPIVDCDHLICCFSWDITLRISIESFGFYRTAFLLFSLKFDIHFRFPNFMILVEIFYIMHTILLKPKISWST